ncbi:MAG: hypothetical protein AAFU67_13115, partial [Bacteroidota bacterium]
MKENRTNYKLPKFVGFFLILFLLADLGFSALQHYHRELDGDIANLTLPGPGYQQIFDNPFGADALLKGERYAGTNRYFSHLATKAYFDYSPPFFQLFVAPIESLYIANSAIKILLQVGFIFILALYTQEQNEVHWSQWIGTAALASVLFQTFGNRMVMGIIDPATTYNFFYAFPSLGCLLFFLPFYRVIMHD